MPSWTHHCLLARFLQNWTKNGGRVPPLLQSISSPTLKGKHWTEISSFRALEKIIKMLFSLLCPLLLLFSVDNRFRGYSFCSCLWFTEKTLLSFKSGPARILSEQEINFRLNFYFSSVQRDGMSKYKAEQTGGGVHICQNKKPNSWQVIFSLVSNRPDWATLIDFQRSFFISSLLFKTLQKMLVF